MTLSVADVLAATAEHYGVDAASFATKHSKQLSRDVAAWLARRLTVATLRELAEPFGLGHPDSVRDLVRRTETAMAESLDQNVGRILAELKRLGIDERTLVILTSDNGGFLKWKGMTVTGNHPLRSGKGSLYEGGVRVPLIVRWPGVTRPNSVSGGPVTTCDFYPTIREALRLPGDETHNARCDGQSLVALLKNPAAHLDRELLFWHYPHYYPTTEPVSSIRAGDWKLAHQGRYRFHPCHQYARSFAAI